MGGRAATVSRVPCREFEASSVGSEKAASLNVTRAVLLLTPGSVERRRFDACGDAVRSGNAGRWNVGASPTCRRAGDHHISEKHRFVNNYLL